MSKNSDYLTRHGWIRDSRRKAGCMVIERWYKPPDGTLWPHGTALEIERRAQKVKKQKKNT